MPTPPKTTLEILGSFDIIVPLSNEAALLQAGNTVHVEVRDNGNHDGFKAAVYPICDANPPPFGSCNTSLVKDGATDIWKGDVPVIFLDVFDILQSNKKVVVYGFIGSNTASKINPCRVYRTAGSGSSFGSASGSRCSNCSGVQPLPVTVQLSHAGGITNGTCQNCAALNASVLLVHPNDPCFSCCWFSGPIAFCGVRPGFWKLEKTTARQWDLWCYQASNDNNPDELAHYTFTTANDLDCSFPITLTLQSSGGECNNWPNQITISPAP